MLGHPLSLAEKLVIVFICRSNMPVWVVASSTSLFLHMLYSHKHSFELSSYIIQLYDSEEFCVHKNRSARDTEISTIFPCFAVHWHSDLKVLCSHATADKQLHLQKMHTSQKSLFSEVCQLYKIRIISMSSLESAVSKTQHLQHNIKNPWQSNPDQFHLCIDSAVDQNNVRLH